MNREDSTKYDPLKLIKFEEVLYEIDAKLKEVRLRSIEIPNELKVNTTEE